MRGMKMRIRMNKKVGIYTAAAVGAAVVLSIAVKAVGEYGRKRVFTRGLTLEN